MYGDGFITWQMGGSPTWTLKEAGMQANALTMVSQRPISNEPMVGHGRSLTSGQCQSSDHDIHTVCHFELRYE